MFLATEVVMLKNEVKIYRNVRKKIAKSAI